MSKKLKIVWRKDSIDLSFLCDGMAKIANDHILVVCIVESTIVLVTSKKNIEATKTILEKNSINYASKVKIENKTGLTVELSDLKKLEEAFKKAGIEIDNLERKEIKIKWG